MMKMKTQFGDMVITDDNQVIADDKLKEAIYEEMQDTVKPDIISTQDYKKQENN